MALFDVLDLVFGQPGWHIVSTTVTLASAVAAVTKTNKDDKAIGVISNIVNFAALNWSRLGGRR